MSTTADTAAYTALTVDKKSLCRGAVRPGSSVDRLSAAVVVSGDVGQCKHHCAQCSTAFNKGVGFGGLGAGWGKEGHQLLTDLEVMDT